MAETSSASSSEVNCYNYNCSGIFSMQAGVIHNAKQKHLGCKKGEANQKQQLSDYGYIAILATKSFDIKLRPRCYKKVAK